MEELREKNREKAGTEGGETVFDAEDISRNKFIAVLSYRGGLFLAPLLAGKKSPYARYHANQGVLLLLATLAINVLSNVISNLGGFVFGASLVAPFMPGELKYYFMYNSSYGIYRFIELLLIVAHTALFIFQCIGYFNAASGRAKELPVIGGIRLLK